MKVLVTGSSGWLGRHLVPLLKGHGYEPIGLDVAPSEWTQITGTVADRELINGLFADHRFDAVVHAAALHKPDIARYPQSAFVDVNVTGTLNLLEAASERPGVGFVFTSTTSLMISQKIRDERSNEAIWLDEDAGPLEPRNIYGVTKLAAEGLCRQHQLERGLNAIVLRTARFFPEDDDTITSFTGPNLKANELLHRRATVEDMARAHIAALEGVGRVGFGLYIVSAPTPFQRSDAGALKKDARRVIAERFPDVERLYKKQDWRLPQTIGRVYDGSRIGRELGFAYETSFGDILQALEHDAPPPMTHDSAYASPMLGIRQTRR